MPLIKQITVVSNALSINSRGGKGPRVPPILIHCAGQRYPAFEVSILGPSVMVYRPERPLQGSVLWVETGAPISFAGPDGPQDLL